jgi:hypothetical protein
VKEGELGRAEDSASLFTIVYRLQVFSCTIDVDAGT